jgi:hypothetical protein
MQLPRRSGTDRGAGPNKPPSITSVAASAIADEIAAVQRKIKDVEGQIQQLSDKITGVSKAKGEGWQDEMACLQQDWQSLVVEERQLRENKGQLREKELVLIKRENRRLGLR